MGESSFSGKLIPFAESILPGTTFADQTWLSTRNDRWGSDIDISLTIAGNSLSLATNAVTTMMIAYKLWYVSVDGIHWT